MNSQSAFLAAIVSCGLSVQCYAGINVEFSDPEGFHYHHQHESSPERDNYGMEQRAERGAERERAKRARQRAIEEENARQEEIVRENAIHEQWVKNAEAVEINNLHENMRFPFAVGAGGRVSEDSAYEAAFKKVLERRRTCGTCDLNLYTMSLGQEYRAKHQPKPPRTELPVFDPLAIVLRITVPRTEIPPAPITPTDAKKADREAIHKVETQLAFEKDIDQWFWWIVKYLATEQLMDVPNAIKMLQDAGVKQQLGELYRRCPDCEKEDEARRLANRIVQERIASGAGLPKPPPRRGFRSEPLPNQPR